MSGVIKTLDESITQFPKPTSKENLSQLLQSKMNSNEKAIHLSVKLDSFEMQLDSYIAMRNKEFDALNQKIDQAEGTIRNKRQDLRQTFDKKLEEMQQYQNSLQIFYNQEATRKNDMERKIQSMLTEKTTEVNNGLSDLKTQGVNIYASYEKDFDTEFNQLQSDVAVLSESESDLTSNMNQKTQEFFGFLNSQFHEEVRTKEENEAASIELFKTIMRNIGQDIEKESQTRKKRVEEIVTLLEETCQRLERASGDHN